MRLPKPPMEMLNETIVYLEYIGEGDYNKREYAGGVTIEHVRIDRSSKYSWNGKNKEIQYKAVVLCYQGLTVPLPNFREQSILRFDGKEHVIVNVIQNKEPFKDVLYSVELEVI
ncbi:MULTISPECIES: putative minor capsid protein [unclassified Streptococcus]|uniref:putative minor capsid protein n=1 Tax=unclassified Streptococcus TaxID=2608887 RepID=UPI001072E534|nr:MULTISPECIES: putative minor capsid protein [unclassified Streptococcus]MBF0788166.1 minor capsid protein [Streptococcus sp. 19428wC2_LYSM12]MCQ9212281.1 minor capsid protein [Streptococcus sp. B01]MCQ9213612.1 minor capsid protein [Streptococcus sp. O1]TFV04767.1 minor capsid protein [Streptococcus sp. LYSM12]